MRDEYGQGELSRRCQPGHESGSGKMCTCTATATAYAGMNPADTSAWPVTHANPKNASKMGYVTAKSMVAVNE